MKKKKKKLVIDVNKMFDKCLSKYSSKSKKCKTKNW